MRSHPHLGTPRLPSEATRIGTMRRPPRGVPNLAPGTETMKLGQDAESPAAWSAFVRKYKAEMAAPEARHELELLAVLSHTANFSVGCYCEHEERCHRSILKQLLIENGAKFD